MRRKGMKRYPCRKRLSESRQNRLRSYSNTKMLQEKLAMKSNNQALWWDINMIDDINDYWSMARSWAQILGGSYCKI
jgi:hypothetical protein